MKPFKFSIPSTTLVFGRGSLDSIGVEAKELGKKALLVTGRKSMQKLGFLGRTLDFLEKEGVEVIHYGEVEPNPTVEIINRGAEKAISCHCDLVVGIGGG